MKKVNVYIGLLLLIPLVTIAAKLPNWYPVAQWEIDTCSAWGGSTTGQRATPTSDKITLSQTTLTLLGERFIYNADSFEGTVYKLNWYLEPLAPISFRIELFNISNGATEVVVPSDTAAINAPGFGFKALELDTEFTHLVIRFGGQRVEVPIVNIETI